MLKPNIILSTEGLWAGYEPTLSIVRDANIQAYEGEILLLLGPNGAGKSTLIKTIAGVVQKHAGTVHFDGGDITRIAAHRMIDKGLAFVPQTENVFVSMTIPENLAIAAHRLPRGMRKQRVETIYEFFPDLARLRSLQAGRLSGGQRQMLAIARAMIVEPRLIMLDEPSAGLSPKMVEMLFEQLLRVRDAGMSIVMVEQNVRAAFTIADRAYILVEGTQCHEGTAATLLDDPDVAHSYLGLTGAHNASAGATQ
ncbi:ABC transporter ATP-binding protein (plasmid) [Burkholderia sp. SFA1]|nr:ABC transporter ATP-binding protein [Burkholderia sp. SFA1]